jgi:hypothetical protein
VPGSFDAACDGIRNCVACGLPTDVLVILTRQTAPHAAGLGAQRVGVLRLYPLGRAKRIWGEIALSLEDQMASIRALQAPEKLVLKARAMGYRLCDVRCSSKTPFLLSNNPI